MVDIKRKAEHVTIQLETRASTTKSTAWELLVVDDEKECARLFAEILKRDGYSVRTAHSGPEALAALRKCPADLVLADMVMPGMNGLELLANIKEFYPDTDVIILTGYGTIEESLKAMRRGAADFLPKPFQPRELARLTAECLRAKQVNSDEAFLKQSRVMAELACVLTETTDLAVLTSRAVELACETFHATSAILFSFDGAQETFGVLARTGAVEYSNQKRDIDTHGMEAVRTGNTILSAASGAGDCRLYAPLVIAGRSSGLLYLNRSDGPWFAEKSVEVIKIFTTHLALALESARLYETSARHVCDLEDLLVRSRSMGLKLRADEVLDQLLVEVERFTTAEISAVLIPDKDGPTVRIRPDLPEDSLLRQAIQDTLMKVAPFIRGNAPSRQASHIPCEIRKKMTSFLHAPVAADSSCCGVVGIFSSSHDAFAADDAQRLAALAVNAATAVKNAEQFQHLSVRCREGIALLGRSVDSLHRSSIGHSKQVSIFSGALARALNLDKDLIAAIEDAALLHDIGKICIPDSILDKPGPLSSEEFAIIKTHPVYGAKMFDDAPHLSDVVPVVRHHHENYDGSGYPDGLTGDDIPLAARVIALGDVFDALISQRPYRPAIELAQARQMIELKAGSQFDPHLAEVFLSLPLEEYIQPRP